MRFVQVDMSWSSTQKKNYLHLAAERGLPKVLRLLLERARFQNITFSKVFFPRRYFLKISF